MSKFSTPPKPELQSLQEKWGLEIVTKWGEQVRFKNFISIAHARRDCVTAKSMVFGE
jgi:hypothetical protein